MKSSLGPFTQGIEPLQPDGRGPAGFRGAVLAGFPGRGDVFRFDTHLHDHVKEKRRLRAQAKLPTKKMYRKVSGIRTWESQANRPETAANAV